MMMTVMSASPVHHLFARRTAALSGLLVLSPPLGSIAAPPRCSGAPLAASGAASGAAPACVKAVTHAAAGGSTCAARRTATRAAHATEQQPAQQEPHTETAPTAIKRRRGRPPKQARPEPPAAPGPPATQLLQDATTSARGADPAPEEREEAAPLTIPLSSETGDEGAAGSAPRAAQPAEARAPHREVASGGVLWPLEDEEDEGLGFDFFDPNVLRWPPPQAPLATVAPSPQQGPESGEVTGRHLGTPGPQHRQRGRSRGEGRRVGTSPSAASPTAAPGGAAAPEPAPAAPPPSGSRWMAGLAQQGGQPPPAEPSAPAPAPAPAAPPVAARAGAGAHEAWWGGYSRGGDARAASVPGAGMADDEAWAREEQGVGGPPALPRQHWWQLPPEEAGAAVVAPSPGQRGGQGAPTLRPGGGLREQQLLSPLQGGGTSFHAVGGAADTLFVKGLPAQAPEDLTRAALVAAFGAFGRVAQVRLPSVRQAGGRRELRGIAFVVFESPRAKARALAHGSPVVVLGRRLHVDAEPDGTASPPGGEAAPQGSRPQRRHPPPGVPPASSSAPAAPTPRATPPAPAQDAAPARGAAAPARRGRYL